MLVAGRIRLMKFGQFCLIVRVRSGCEKIDGIVASLLQPGLDKVTEEFGIAAVYVDEYDLVKAIPGDLVTGGFEHIPDDSFRQGESAGLMPGFVDLAVEII